MVETKQSRPSSARVLTAPEGWRGCDGGKAKPWSVGAGSLESQCGACGQASPMAGRNGTRKTGRHDFVATGRSNWERTVDLPSPASSWYSRSRSPTRSHPSWRHVSIAVGSSNDAEGPLDGVQFGFVTPSTSPKPALENKLQPLLGRIFGLVVPCASGVTVGSCCGLIK